MDTARNGFFLVSPARLSAIIAVLLLFAVVFWNSYTRSANIVSNATTTSSQLQNETFEEDPLSALRQSASSSPLTPLGTSIIAQAAIAYDNANKDGTAPEAGKSAVEALGASIDPGVQYNIYSASDIKTTADSSKDRVINYRADLRTALAPLLENKEYELDLFANYVETKDPKYLTALRMAAANYRLAITNTEKVTAPADAASYQAAILTAMSQFASALDALSDNASDPIASATLLKTYLAAEGNMISAFNAIGKYASGKIL